MFTLQSSASISPRAVGLPVLAGEKMETLFRGGSTLAAHGDFHLHEVGPWRVGQASALVEGGIEQSTRRLYDGLFSAAAGLNLCRIWNFVPQINETGDDGLENYRAFCRGRSLAFEVAFGGGFKQRLSAASAVGTDAEWLTVMFAACAAEPENFENPGQVPAYEYPRKHGPRPPSFSRATVVPTGSRADVFISGTAAIEGHESVAPGDTAGQLACTLRNLRAISLTCGLGETLGADGGGERHFKIYVRHERELAAIRAALEGPLLRATDKVSYLRADICRAELNLEIEATVLGVQLA